MFDLFKQREDTAPSDVKTLRQEVLQFIKDHLRKWEGGEGANVKGLQLFLAPEGNDQHLYEAVLYIDEPRRFQEEELQRIVDDFAIELPQGWTFEHLFVETLPAEAFKAKALPVAIHVSTKKQPVLTSRTTAFLRVVEGEAEKELYELKAGSKACIGREKKVQTPEGFMRENTIAFLSNSENKSNRFISRQHAHIEWNKEVGAFFLFADEGGVPPRNKIKVQTEEGAVIRLQTTQVGHHLQEGDQIVLGETALLTFNYTDTEP